MKETVKRPRARWEKGLPVRQVLDWLRVLQLIVKVVAWLVHHVF